jgi:acetate---CoA ligase (ADP-forming)
MRGRNLAIISRSGGHAIIASDACELSGFRLAHFPEEFLREIESHFRASVIRLTNPIDLGDLFDLDLYARIVERTLQLEGVDGVVFLHTSLSETEHHTSRMLVERIIDLVERYNKPVAFYLSANNAEVSYLKQNYDLPVFTQVVETVRALEISHRFCCGFAKAGGEDEKGRSIDGKTIRGLLDKAKSDKRDLLLSEAMEVLERCGIETTHSVTARSVAEAQAAAEELGFPVVIKVIAEEISHKSNVGGVELNLGDLQAVAEAHARMMERLRQAYPDVTPEGVMVQPMITGGWELILGGRQDKQFGPVVLVGLGGIFAEFFEEVAVRVAPITAREALEMIESLRGSQVLKGARGHLPADLDSVVHALLQLSQLLCEFPEVQEVDVNPLKVFHKGMGCKAVDARVILQQHHFAS